MIKEDRDEIYTAIETDGFDYAMTDYSDWSRIKDDKFQELLKLYVESRYDLRDYLDVDNMYDDLGGE